MSSSIGQSHFYIAPNNLQQSLYIQSDTEVSKEKLTQFASALLSSIPKSDSDKNFAIKLLSFSNEGVAVYTNKGQQFTLKVNASAPITNDVAIIDQQQQIVEIAKKTRPPEQEVQADFLANALNQQKPALDHLFADAKDFPTAEEGISDVLKEKLNLSISPSDITKQKDGMFLAKDSATNSTYKVRTFSGDENTAHYSFLLNASASDVLNTLKHSNPGDVLYRGKCLENGKSVYFNIEKNESFPDLCAIHKDITKGERPLADGERAFELLGKAMGELHTKDATPAAIKVPFSIKEKEFFLTKCMEKLESRQDVGISPEKLKSYFYSCVQNLADSKSNAGYAHDNAYLDKFSADLEKGSLRIDFFNPLHSSIGVEHPQGIPGVDFVRIKDDLETQPAFGMKQTDMEALRQSFEKGYQETGGKLPDAAQQAYGELLIDLRALTWWLSPEVNAWPPEDSVLKVLLSRSVERLKKAVNV